MSEINFRSTVGKLAGVYSHNVGNSAPAVLVVGSSIVSFEAKRKTYDGAMDKLFESFVESGFSVLRFNFRQISGDSRKDDLDEDAINLLDLTAALDWLHSKNLECRNFWVCAVDLGTLAALQLIMRRPEVENYILLSPNLKKNDLSFVVPCSASGLLVRASEDLRFLEEDCLILQEKLVTKTESKIKSITIHGAERNFETELQQFKTRVLEYITTKILDDRHNLGAMSANKRRRRKKRPEAEEEKIIYMNPIKPLDIEEI
ncbi:MAG: hypothetical protein LBS34_02370 [Rickettsiales bacterium]|jgi:alpha/beta superfamily hydrolase|nr:hypothetical protein [Rickettsiales bacterium]